MIRQMIKIDTDSCNGCGICVNACHEGALEIVNNKAQIIKDDYCDGLGNCLPVCPMNAITFELREAPRFDEEAVVENMIKLGKPIPEDLQAFAKNIASNNNLKDEVLINTGSIEQKQEKAQRQCSGSMVQSLFSQAPSKQNASLASIGIPSVVTPTTAILKKDLPDAGTSQLQQWPIQIKLAPVNATFFNNAHLLIAADCCAYAYANFHKEFMHNKVTLIGCPKLDSCDYSEKITEIIINNTLKSVTVVRMEVPCCSGIEKAVTTAVEHAYKVTGKLIPWQIVTLTRNGNVLE